MVEEELDAAVAVRRWGETLTVSELREEEELGLELERLDLNARFSSNRNCSDQLATFAGCRLGKQANENRRGCSVAARPTKSHTHGTHSVYMGIHKHIHRPTLEYTDQHKHTQANTSKCMTLYGSV